VIEVDIDSAVDAETIVSSGAKAIQLHTGGMCHLDADMTRQGLHEFGTEDLDFVVLENVGNPYFLSFYRPSAKLKFKSYI
jgi:hydrogenase nickel incorporation protein HypB